VRGSEPLNRSSRIPLSVGNHYLRFKDMDDDSADADRSYTVSYFFEPDPDVNEPNGNFSTRQENLNHATNLVLGTPGQGYIGFNADQDWFQVFVAQPGIYNFMLTNTGASPVDLSVSIYRPGGQILILTRSEEDQQGENGPTEIEGQLYFFQTGSYYFLVQDLDNNETDLDLPYQIQLTSVPIPGGSIEPGEDRDDAQMILSGQEITGFVDFEQDRDWWGIEITGNQDVVVELWTENASPVEFIWFMYAPESTLVYASAGDTDEINQNPINIVMGDDEEFWVDEDHPGIYLFKFSDYNRNDWDTTVPYHFRVTLTPHVE